MTKTNIESLLNIIPTTKNPKFDNYIRKAKKSLDEKPNLPEHIESQKERNMVDLLRTYANHVYAFSHVKEPVKTLVHAIIEDNILTFWCENGITNNERFRCKVAVRKTPHGYILTEPLLPEKSSLFYFCNVGATILNHIQNKTTFPVSEKHLFSRELILEPKI